MNENSNIELILRLFEAFGEGDIPKALEMFSEDVEFQSPVTRAEHKYITWSGKRSGRGEVASFFKEMNESVSTDKMEVLDLVAKDEKVFVEGRNSGVVRSTGKRYEHDWIMTFEISEGRITRNMHYYDTADITKAFE
jgi:steroid delta-isomerase-like uncharacterized protein